MNYLYTIHLSSFFSGNLERTQKPIIFIQAPLEVLFHQPASKTLTE